MKGWVGTIIIGLTLFGAVFYWFSSSKLIVEEQYWIGEIGNGTKYTFKIENSLSVPLKVINVQFGCSCVSSLGGIQVGGVVLTPGEQIEIPLIFHPSGGSPEVVVPVLIETDSRRHRIMKSKLVGAVHHDLRNFFVRASHRALLLERGEVRNIAFESDTPIAVANISADARWLRYSEEYGRIRVWIDGNVKGGQLAKLKVVVKVNNESQQFLIPVVAF